MKRSVCICIVSVILVLGLSIILYKSLLLPWQYKARQNKKIVMQYAREHYPSAKLVGCDLNSINLNFWSPPASPDLFYFELDGMYFTITAREGDVLVDGYTESVIKLQFDNMINNGFLKIRNVDAMISYFLVDDLPKDQSQYTGVILIDITVSDQGSTPQSVGWLYDFYKYWKGEGEFLAGYSIAISIVVNGKIAYHIDYNSKDEFLDESAFYDAFYANADQD